MKRMLMAISMLAVSSVLVAGCATTGDLEKVQAQEKLTGAKADQAMQDAQAAKSAADAAAAKADAAAARAENAIMMAEERERIAAEKERLAAEKEKQQSAQKARMAEAAFKKSMRK